MSVAVGTLAVSALAPATSFAGKALKLEVGGTGLAGAPILLSSTEVTISNAFWDLGCSEGSLSGAMEQNRGASDYVVINNGAFAGGGSEGLCASAPEFVTYFAPVQTPELKLNTKGQALLHFTRLRLVPKADVGTPEEHACIVSAATLKGTFPVSTTAQPLVLTFTSAKMKMEAQGSECGAGRGSKPLFSGTFTVTSRGSTVEAVIFTPR
ncbi:MAG TPA: hypothetical protein VLZ06_05200 [Solirubrobacteraceae bacterium]|nr:hypothetical protein [Solirubrobacteraceae bacterium]